MGSKLEAVLHRLDEIEASCASQQAAMLSLLVLLILSSQRSKDEGMTRAKKVEANAQRSTEGAIAAEPRSRRSKERARSSLDETQLSPKSSDLLRGKTRPRPSRLGQAVSSYNGGLETPESESPLDSSVELKRRKAAFAARSGGLKKQRSDLAVQAAKRQVAVAAEAVLKAKKEEEEEAWGWHVYIALGIVGVAAFLGGIFAMIIAKKSVGESTFLSAGGSSEL